MMYKNEDLLILNKYLLPVFLGMIVFLNDQVLNIIFSSNEETSKMYLNAVKGFNFFTGLLIVCASLILVSMFPKPKWILYILSSKKQKVIINLEKNQNDYSELLKIDSRINYALSFIVYYTISLVFIVVIIASLYLLFT